MIGSYWAPVMLGSSQTNPTAQLLLQAFLKWKRQADLLKKDFQRRKVRAETKNIISSIYIWYLLSALNTTAAWAEGVLFPPIRGEVRTPCLSRRTSPRSWQAGKDFFFASPFEFQKYGFPILCAQEFLAFYPFLTSYHIIPWKIYGSGLFFFQMRGKFVCVILVKKNDRHKPASQPQVRPSNGSMNSEGRSRRLRIGRRLPNPGRKRRPGPRDGGREVSWRSFRMEKLAKQKRTKKKQRGWGKKRRMLQTIPCELSNTWKMMVEERGVVAAFKFFLDRSL